MLKHNAIKCHVTAVIFSNQKHNEKLFFGCAALSESISVGAVATITLRTVNDFAVYRVGPKKRGHGLMTIILSNLNRLKKLTEHSLINMQLNGYLKCHRTLHMLIRYLVKH